MIVNCDLWFPIVLSRHLGPVPVPMRVMFLWHYANRRTILESRQAVDPFPVEDVT